MAKQGHRAIALKALRAHDDLATTCGVLLREPEKLFSITANMKPAVAGEDGARALRSDDEIRADIQELLAKARTL